MTPEIGQTIPHGRRFDEAQTSDCRLAHFSVGPHTSSTAGSSSDSPRQPRLEDCMDLKDSVGWVPLLAQAHDEVLRISREQGLPLPRQTGSTHRLDRVVIEVTVAILEREGIRIRAVRAVFAERAPAFPGSFSQRGIPRPARRPRHRPDWQRRCRTGRLSGRSSTTARCRCRDRKRREPVVDPEDAGETIRRYFENASDGDLADDIRRAARQPQQVDR
jgi:hypothetical protein